MPDGSAGPSGGRGTIACYPRTARQPGSDLGSDGNGVERRIEVLGDPRPVRRGEPPRLVRRGRDGRRGERLILGQDSLHGGVQPGGGLVAMPRRDPGVGQHQAGRGGDATRIGPSALTPSPSCRA